MDDPQVRQRWQEWARWARLLGACVCLPVLAPRRFAGNAAAYGLVARFGWVLILLRWGYYSVRFQFRDYEGRWAPFAAPPFGLGVTEYAHLQRTLAVPFGGLMMLALAAVAVLFVRCLGRRAGFVAMFNVLGATFFLPFVPLQPCDQVLIAAGGWRVAPVVVLHTAVLVWESWATMAIVAVQHRLRGWQEGVGIVLLCGTWIGIAAAAWR